MRGLSTKLNLYLTASVLAFPAAAAAVSFGGTNYSVGAATQFVAVGDFNNDGYSDLASVGEVAGSSPKTATVAILLNNGAGAFPATPNYTYPVGSSSQGDKLAIGHINSDANLDLAVTGMGMVSILLGAGDGTFAPASPASVAVTNAMAIALGHVDDDTKLDLVVGGYTPKEFIAVLRGNGDGTFQSFSLPNIWYGKVSPRHIALGDFNRDGKRDVVAANQGKSSVSVILGAGNATPFSGAATPYPVPPGPVWLAVGDVTNDDISDLAVTSDPGKIAVYLGNTSGNGTFVAASPATFSPGQSHPGNVVIADMDGDGNRDLVVPVSGGDIPEVAIFLGNGQGTFTRSAIAAPAGALAVGDFNCDGRLDMAVTNRATSRVSVLLNQSAAGSKFDVPDGDVAALVCAIKTANATAGADTINLAAQGTYTLTKAENADNGLPIITSEITINGAGATIERSTAPNTPAFRIFKANSTAKLALNRVTIKDGRADIGAGVYNRGGTVTLTGSTVSGNTTPPFATAWGAGLMNEFGAARMTLVDSRIIENSGHLRGTGITNEGTLEVTASTIAGNTNGAGLYSLGGNVTVTNSTVSGNTHHSTQGGGGIILYGSAKLTLVNSTVTGNTNIAGQDKTGGINNDGGTVTLKNTIVAGNTPSDCRNTNILNHEGRNLFGTDGSCSPTANDVTSDPQSLGLGALALNAPGKTETHALSGSSPAKDAADNAVCPSTDQRGVARPQPPGGACDIGAYEF